MRTAIKGSQP